MTQDPYGRPPGSGYVGRGEVVPDDEADAPPATAPMTRFQKVASAWRGDRADPAVTDRASSELGAGPTGPRSPDPNGTRPGTTPAGLDAPEVRDEADRDAARPEEVVAVRRPDEGARDYWDDTDETGSEEATAAVSPDEPAASADPTITQPDLYGTTVRAETGAATAGAAVPAGAAEATGVGAAEASLVGAAEPGLVGRHAAVSVREGGLRPGEPDSALGDFDDLTFGRMLPDTAEFRARWQQVQFRFVDDPQGSVTEAADVIAQVTAKLEAAIAERQRAVAARQSALRDRWSEGKSGDTESLRETLLMYRALLDQLTGPGAG